METFLIGTKEVSFEDFQNKKIETGANFSNGFEIAYLSHWPYLKGQGFLDIPPEVIGFFNSSSELFCQDNIGFNKGWSYLALKGLLEYLFFTNEELAFKHQHLNIKYDEDILKVWPNLKTFIEGLPYDIVSAAVFALQPNSRISLHTDKNKYGIDKFLIPLNKPNDAFFAFYHYGQVPLEAGHIYAIDASYPHYAVNQSNEVRYHLILRGAFEKKLPQYMDWLQKSYQLNGPPQFDRIPEGIKWKPSNLISK